MSCLEYCTQVDVASFGDMYNVRCTVMRDAMPMSMSGECRVGVGVDGEF